MLPFIEAMKDLAAKRYFLLFKPNSQVLELAGNEQLCIDFKHGEY